MKAELAENKKFRDDTREALTELRTISIETNNGLKNIFGDSDNPGVLSQMGKRIDSSASDVTSLLRRVENLESSRTWLKGVIAALAFIYAALLAIFLKR